MKKKYKEYEGYQKLLLRLFGGSEKNWPVSSGLIEKIEEQLTTMLNKEAEVIRLRFGLKDDIPLTFKDVGKYLDLVPYKIKKIQDHALRKLKHPSRARGLRAYFQQTSEEISEETNRLRAKIAEYKKLAERIREVLNEFEKSE